MAGAKVANAKPQSRGVFLGKVFVEALSSVPSFTAVSQKGGLPDLHIGLSRHLGEVRGKV